MSSELCEGALKTIYASQEEASRAKKAIRGKQNTKRGKYTWVVYSCGDCGGWHVGKKMRRKG